MSLFGVLNVNKPAGPTSRRVVDRVARMARPAKVGHAGTLDPLAAGVLIVCIGGATRLVEYVQRMPKRYRGEYLLGRESDTEDVQGEVVELPDARMPTLEELASAAVALTGETLQRPPAFSALRVAGRRAYDLARSGQAVELAPRPVTVYRLDIVEYRYPALTLEIECSGGTYVRSLGRDLALAVGSAAVMSGLTRTAIGAFTLADSLDFEQLTPENLNAQLRSPLTALVDLPAISLGDDDVRRVRQGLRLDAARLLSAAPSDAAGAAVEYKAVEYKAVDAEGRLIAILTARSDGTLAPSRTFAGE